MSRRNRVNKDLYTQAGRLTPDEMARERVQQQRPARPASTERAKSREAPRQPQSGRAAPGSRTRPRGREE